MNTVWIGLGTNLGNRAENLEKAQESLRSLLSRTASAPIYETAPRDFFAQGDFLNTVMRGETDMDPVELLEQVQRIERCGGRNRVGVPPGGPRTIDIDILLYDDLVMQDGGVGEGGLTIPHPRMHRRLFVLKPLLDLDPALSDPVDEVPWSRKASQLGEQLVKLYRR